MSVLQDEEKNMSEEIQSNSSYFLGAIRHVATNSSLLVSSSKYLNDAQVRDWLVTQFLRRNGPDVPAYSDTSNGLIPALARLRDVEKLDRLIAEEKEKNPKFRAWLEKQPVCRHTKEDFAEYAPETFGGIYHRHVVAQGYLMNLGWKIPDVMSDREYILFRSGQMHDFEHILTGGGFNTLGELLPLFLRLSNFHAHFSLDLASELFPLYVFAGVRMVMRSALHYPETWPTVLDLIQRGLHIGQNSECLLMAEIESAFHLPLDEARRALGVVGAVDIDTEAASRIFDDAGLS
jgi:ubiquinone biosynthesis protein COQ4